ncbi:MAG: ElyC/SanA/YdcF family protein [Verrucomicrobiales bacterium]|nr:ElyC/SanA/YdcF family protein [Verrucomicrobiales bacterium]
MGKLIWRLLKSGLFLLLAVLGGIVVCNLWVTGSTAQRTFYSVGKVPYRDVALVLGTSKLLVSGEENLHFKHRIEAARDLYEGGKVAHFLLSGDDKSDPHYNEPDDMRAALVGLGVPEEVITLDRSGMRTLDSVERAKEIWKLETLVVVSDGFHVSRAVFIADRKGLEAVVAYASEAVELEKSAKSRVREWLARVKAVLDTTVFDEEAEYGEDGTEEPIVVKRREPAAE